MFNLDVYKDHNAPGYLLLGATLKKYGLGCLDYDPAILTSEIEKDFNVKLTTLQANKLHAAIAVMTTDSFYNDWRVFEATCHLFHNEDIDADLVNPLDAEDIAIGLAEVTLIKSDINDSEDLVFDDEVRVYAGRIFYEYGFCNPPKIFPSAIMPKKTGTACNDKEKNEALLELFDAHCEHLIDYAEKLT